MAFLRAFLLLFAMIAFYVIGAPVQALAIARGWPLADRIPRFFHRLICAIIGIRVRVSGVMSDELPLLIIANHVSWVDIVTLSTDRPVCFLAKREMRSWPIFGTFAVLQRSVFVDRAKISGLPHVNAEIAGRLKDGRRVVVFAESTTGDGTALLRFRAAHLGAAQAFLDLDPAARSVAVQPVALSYTSRDGRAAVPWYGDMLLLPHVWRLLKAGSFDCRIRYGARQSFGRDTSRKAMAQTMQTTVQTLLEEDLIRN